VPLERLFDLSYLRRPPTVGEWVALVLYTPVGVVLALVRVLLTVLLCTYATLTKHYAPALSPTDKACVPSPLWPPTGAGCV
jgi:hypothetical protein